MEYGNMAASVMAFFGALVGASIAPGVAVYLNRQSRKRAAQHLAVNVVCSLDPLVTECCKVALDTGELDREGVTTPSVDPPILVLPQKLDWTSIDPQLCFRIRSIPNWLKAIEQRLTEVEPHQTEDEYFAERRTTYGKLGLSALALSTELKSIYGLRDDPDWRSPAATLEEATANAEEKMRYLDSSGRLKLDG